ncbi:chemotaxis protein CheB [Sorangium cellulosum]|uniref:chemotaxis protein CheB n=1 Tax=Sorangium cellulosum TaxID=56 RepID=UPI0013319CCC|nr:chemotaxis protein CheB [Sorangium cellulosum]
MIGASAGGVEALIVLLGGLPTDLPVSLFVVLHLPPTARSMLPAILGRTTRMQVAAAVDGEPIERGRVYVAPVDNHLMIGDGVVRVVHSARENGHRPAVDPLFRTAAEVYGGRVIGVVLSGTRDCGTAGLLEIKRHGGIAVVQDPEDAVFSEMPQSALDNVPVDHCVPLARLPPLLVDLVRQKAGRAPAKARTPEGMVGENVEAVEGEFTCPECGGNLVRNGDGAMLNFRCKVGHRYSPEGLEDEQASALDAALWIALRTIEDSAALARRMAGRAAERNQANLQAHFEAKLRVAEERAALVRRALLGTNDGNGTGAVPRSKRAWRPPAAE